MSQSSAEPSKCWALSQLNAVCPKTQNIRSTGSTEKMIWRESKLLSYKNNHELMYREIERVISHAYCIATCVNGLLAYNYRCNDLEAKFSTVQQVKLEDNFHQMKLWRFRHCHCVFFIHFSSSQNYRPTGPVIKYAVFTIWPELRDGHEVKAKVVEIEGWKVCDVDEL